jgi:predicted cupin superfamily sugar epimerase
VSPQAQHWIGVLGLTAHPEGGWFREVYRSPERVAREALPPRFAGERLLATAILYLLAGGERSCFHRLRADEVWAHHAGGAMHLHLLERGGARRVVVGGETPQVTVPHGTWFAAEPEPGAAFALAGCFVSPGFEYEDFELAGRAPLLAEYPLERPLVTRFTREPGERA